MKQNKNDTIYFALNGIFFPNTNTINNIIITLMINDDWKLNTLMKWYGLRESTVVSISIYYWLLLAQLLTRSRTNPSLICRSEILWSQRPDVTVLLYQSLTFGVCAFSSGRKLTDFCDETIKVPRIYIILIWHEFPLFKTILCVHHHKTLENKKVFVGILL